MRMSVRNTLVAGGFALVGALAGAGILFASGGNVINGCFKTQNGQLRVTDGSCLPSETPISWNQEGPQGIQGPPGPTGPTGPTGPRGPSSAVDGFKFPGNNTAITSTDANNPTVVLQFNVPGGALAITSKVNLHATAGTGGLVRCNTHTLTGYFDIGVASIGAGPGQTLEATESATFTAIEPTAAPLTIACYRINAVGPAPIAGLTEAVAISLEHTTLIGF